MRSELRRLRTIARQLNCCPTHGERLQCGPCDWIWTGTDAEFEELGSLLDRVALYVDSIPPNGRCRCGSNTWCNACHKAAAATIEVPDDLFTPPELARYHELMLSMQRRKDIVSP
jgi:hypothetical protein